MRETFKISPWCPLLGKPVTKQGFPIAFTHNKPLDIRVAVLHIAERHEPFADALANPWIFRPFCRAHFFR